MSSVLDVVDCPQCEWRAFYELQTRTLTETSFCPRCGYREETRPIRKRSRAAGEPVYRTTKHLGHGAYMIKGRNGVSQIGALHRPPTRRIIGRFKKSLRRPGIDAKRSFLSHWNPKRRCVEMVVGKFPRGLP
jgi:hypothetical protein